MAIRGILFDKDGTLIDVTATWVPVYRQLLSELFPGSPDVVERKFEAAGYDPACGAFRAGSVLAGGTTRELIGIWWPGLSERDVEDKIHLLDVVYRDLALSHLKPLMPLDPVLAALRDLGCKLGVATNDTVLSARNHMTHLGVAEHFDIIIGADSVARPKPAGDMVVAFASAAGIDPAEVAMVGDNSHDMETARAGGAGLAIAVLSGNSDLSDIAHLADHVLPSIAALPDLLRSL